ncbi:MAG: hypothetical protein ABIP75_16600 [Pyrinomonadaceae bacterium]
MRAHRPNLTVLLVLITLSLSVLPTHADPLNGPPEPSPYPAQATYQMLCRGIGGGMSFRNGGSVRGSTGEDIVTVQLTFKKSAKAAGAQGGGLDPGQCSWIDRPVNQQEPFKLRFETRANAQLKQELHGSAVDRSPTAAERYPDANTIPVYMKDQSHYYSFKVYNSNEGYFIATGSKYFKPNLIYDGPQPK